MDNFCGGEYEMEFMFYNIKHTENIKKGKHKTFFNGILKLKFVEKQTSEQ
jgi:hypothetical protein